MEEAIYISPENIETVDTTEYCEDLNLFFTDVPNIAKPLLVGAKRTLQQIERLLYSVPAFVNVIKSSIPQETIQAILTNEQKQQLAEGVVKLMTKKDGSLMANLVDPKTKRIVSTVALEKVKVVPEISQALTNYATQIQMAQIAQQIQEVQIAVEEVRQGQEYDRLASAYSCQQKLLQAMAIKNPELKAMALLRLVSDAEDSRHLLMQSQSANVLFIKEQPETFWGKLVSGATPEKIKNRMEEIRESLCAVNMVSLTEAMAYNEMGESEAAQISLQYYADFVKKTYLETPGFVDRLDMIDPSTENYWSKHLPVIEKKIQALPYNSIPIQIGESGDGTACL